MNAPRFDKISTVFAQQRQSRRQTLATPVATPEPDLPPPDAEHGPEMLFVQTYQSGTIAPVDGAEGRYTLTLEAGTGQTVYFSDRPDRLVGTNPTPQFMERLGFLPDNPPNAALVVETATGETDVAVVELFSPLYDPVSLGVTYEVEVLENWQDELGVGPHEAPTDLAAIAPSFGAAHLFIDGALDCPNGEVVCRAYGSLEILGTIPGSWFNNFCSHALWNGPSKHPAYCVPCGTPGSVLTGGKDNYGDIQNVWSYWGSVCNQRIPACNGNCRPSGWCEPDPFYNNVCPTYS